MFGFSNQEVLEVWPQTVLPPPSILPLIKNPIPIKLGLNRETNTEQLFTRSGSPYPHACSFHNSLSVVTPDQISCESSNSLAACVLLGRWCMTVDLLGRMYADTLGRHRHSIFNQLQGFEVIERDLRREMDHLRSSAHRDLQIEVSHFLKLLLLYFLNNSFTFVWFNVLSKMKIRNSRHNMSFIVCVSGWKGKREIITRVI